MKLLDQNIPPIGMGCWAIGGPFFAGDEPYGFAKVDTAESMRTIHAAIDSGIRLFDTAAVYGAGHAERLLGDALGNRSDVIMVSKLGMGFDETTKQVTGDQTDPRQVAKAIDASLKRLKRDTIDIMLLHLNTLPIAEAEPIFEAMEHARTAGKIRSCGWSTDIPESATYMAEREGFVAVEHAMNVFLDVPTIQSVVEQNNLAALIRSPLAMGVLTGKYDETRTVAADDVRSTNHNWRDYFQNGKASVKHLEKLNAIRELLQTGGRTLSQGSLGWLLAKSDRNLPVPGARSVAQVEENAGAIALGPLPADVMTAIETLNDRDPEGEPRAR